MMRADVTRLGKKSLWLEALRGNVKNSSASRMLKNRLAIIAATNFIEDLRKANIEVEIPRNMHALALIRALKFNIKKTIRIVLSNTEFMQNTFINSNKLKKLLCAQNRAVYDEALKISVLCGYNAVVSRLLPYYRNSPKKLLEALDIATQNNNYEIVKQIVDCNELLHIGAIKMAIKKRDFEFAKKAAKKFLIDISFIEAFLFIFTFYGLASAYFNPAFLYYPLIVLIAQLPLLTFAYFLPTFKYQMGVAAIEDPEKFGFNKNSVECNQNKAYQLGEIANKSWAGYFNSYRHYCTYIEYPSFFAGQVHLELSEDSSPKVSI